MFDDGNGDQRFVNLDVSIDTRITLKNCYQYLKIQAFPLEEWTFMNLEQMISIIS